ncbi:MAG: hypothetical protein CM15mV4_0760 [Caudoviricetes sp.]|nr:MAG: hypothetical protein CM15mV4_0760 [Caudoviricetes sp.]
MENALLILVKIKDDFKVTRLFGQKLSEIFPTFMELKSQF